MNATLNLKYSTQGANAGMDICNGIYTHFTSKAHAQIQDVEPVREGSASAGGGEVQEQQQEGELDWH